LQGLRQHQKVFNIMESEDRIDRVRSRAQTAARLNVSLRTLRRLELRGEIERVQITERIIGYRDSAIERFLEERTGAAR
jgi:hypothetical protein